MSSWSTASFFPCTTLRSAPRTRSNAALVDGEVMGSWGSPGPGPPGGRAAGRRAYRGERPPTMVGLLAGSPSGYFNPGQHFRLCARPVGGSQWIASPVATG